MSDCRPSCEDQADTLNGSHVVPAGASPDARTASILSPGGLHRSEAIAPKSWRHRASSTCRLQPAIRTANKPSAGPDVSASCWRIKVLEEHDSAFASISLLTCHYPLPAAGDQPCEPRILFVLEPASAPFPVLSPRPSISPLSPGRGGRVRRAGLRDSTLRIHVIRGQSQRSGMAKKWRAKRSSRSGSSHRSFFAPHFLPFRPPPQSKQTKGQKNG